MRDGDVVKVLDVVENVAFHHRRPRARIEHRLRLLGVTRENHAIALSHLDRPFGVFKVHSNALFLALNLDHARVQRHPTPVTRYVLPDPTIHLRKLWKRKHFRRFAHKPHGIVIIQPQSIIVEHAREHDAAHLARAVPRPKKQRRRRVHHPIPKRLRVSVPSQRSLHAHERVQRLEPFYAFQRLFKPRDVVSQRSRQRRRLPVIPPVRLSSPEAHSDVHPMRRLRPARLHDRSRVRVARRAALHAVVDGRPAHDLARRDAAERVAALERLHARARARERERRRAPGRAAADDDDAHRARRPRASACPDGSSRVTSRRTRRRARARSRAPARDGTRDRRAATDARRSRATRRAHERASDGFGGE